MVRTETCRTLLCRVHRYLLNAFIVCLMGHTAVQTSATSVAQGFLAAEATLFHVLMPIETSRNVNLYNASPMRFSTFVHDLMTLQTPEVQTRTAELRFYRSSLVQMLYKARAFGYCGYGDVGKACVFAFRGSGAHVFVPRMSRQPRDGWAELLFHPRCERATSSDRRVRLRKQRHRGNKGDDPRTDQLRKGADSYLPGWQPKETAS